MRKTTGIALTVIALILIMAAPANAAEESSTLISDLARSVHTGKEYHISLDSLYCEEDRNVENAKAFWHALASTGLETGGYGKMTEGNSVILCDPDAVNTVAAIMKRVLGERAANLSSGMNAQDLWEAICEISLQTDEKNGGEKTVDDIRNGSYIPAVGDQVFLALAAHTAPASFVTLQWCGIIVEVDDNGSARALCGSLDVSGLGMIECFDQSEAESYNSDALLISELGSGTVKLAPSTPDDSEWYMMITVRYCHNEPDLSAAERTMNAGTGSMGRKTLVQDKKPTENIAVGSGGFPSVINDLEGPSETDTGIPARIGIAQAW